MTIDMAISTSRPLVSIVVLAYNNAATIQETLDSIVAQDYTPLEVLICDDASKDQTLEIARRWAKLHQHQFQHIRFFDNSSNLGVCRNLWRGYEAAKGEWLKGIAADDVLMPHAISQYMAATNGNSAVISMVECFSQNEQGQLIKGETLPTPLHQKILKTGINIDTIYILAKENPIPAPGVFLRRSAYEAIGGLDLDFTHLDDWPLWMNLVAHGHSLTFLESPLVRYRKSNATISALQTALQVNPDYLSDLILFYKKYQKRHIPFLVRVDRSIELFRWKLAKTHLRRHPTIYRLTRALFLLSPLRWLTLFHFPNR